MPDILIRGIEMPENCFDCPIFDNFCQERCGVTGTLIHGEIDPQRETLTDCPLLPLPEGHGDLIDRDAMVEALMKCAKNPPDDDQESRWFYLFASEIAKSCQTIVPAEVGIGNGNSFISC